MTKIYQIHKCEICGNIVEVLHTGVGELVCCGQPMTLKEVNTVDAATEKHVPKIEKTDRGYKVSVGEILHPMEEAHHIEWIELIADGKVYRQKLEVGSESIAHFCVEADNVSAREYCNLHGLWLA